MIYGEDLINQYFNEDEVDYIAERSFSEGFDYAYRLFSKKDKKKKKESKRIYLDDDMVNSHRGLGRAAGIGFLGMNPIGGAIGGYVGKKHAETLDREGKSDEEILKGAGKWAAATGASIGGLKGMLAGGPVAGAYMGGVTGLGSYLGARKNTEVRLALRNELNKGRRRED